MVRLSQLKAEPNSHVATTTIADVHHYLPARTTSLSRVAITFRRGIYSATAVFSYWGVAIPLKGSFGNLAME